MPPTANSRPAAGSGLNVIITFAIGSDPLMSLPETGTIPLEQPTRKTKKQELTFASKLPFAERLETTI